MDNDIYVIEIHLYCFHFEYLTTILHNNNEDQFTYNIRLDHLEHFFVFFNEVYYEHSSDLMELFIS